MSPRRAPSRADAPGPPTGTLTASPRTWLPGSPPDGAEYPDVLGSTPRDRRRAALGLVLAIGAYPLLLPVIDRVLVTLAWVTTAGSQDRAGYARQAGTFELPSGLLAANLAIAALIPVTWLLVAGLHRVRPRWLSSVRPRIRWRYLLAALALSLVVPAGVPLLTSPPGPVPDWSERAHLWSFLVVVALSSPLQAVAEEVFFRGYLLQAFTTLLTRPWAGVLASAVVFALLHGGQSPAQFTDRLALGLIAGVLVWRTGGLEAAIAAHAVMNVATYTVAVLTTSVADERATGDTSWLDAATDVGGFALFALGALLIAHRLRLRTRVDLARGT